MAAWSIPMARSRCSECLRCDINAFSHDKFTPISKRICVNRQWSMEVGSFAFYEFAKPSMIAWFTEEKTTYERIYERKTSAAA